MSNLDQLINPLPLNMGWIALYPDGAITNLPDYQMELVEVLVTHPVQDPDQPYQEK